MCLLELEKEVNDGEYTYTVDCFINKFGYMFPSIPKYILYLNRYDFNIRLLKNGEFELDFANVEKYFKDMLDLYCIKKQEIDYVSLDKAIVNRFIILPCDSFYLPYSKQNYMNYHLEHNILIKSGNSDDFFVYDDNPFFCGQINKTIIHNAYSFFNRNIYEYASETTPNREYMIRFFLKNGMNYKFSLFEMIETYINSKFKEIQIIQNLNELRIPLKRFEAFLVICKNLASLIGYDNVEKCIKAAKSLNNEMILFSNLVSIGLKNPERDISRISKRCIIGKRKENELKKEFRDLVNKMEEYYVEI